MAAKKTGDDRSLKRLGGGRWQTRDERFTIEPQSGTWVLVDAEQTDDLGLAMVRGPFRSLTEAKAAVEAARGAAAPASPLADRVKEAATRPPRSAQATTAPPAAKRTRAAPAAPRAAPEPDTPEPAAPPPEPRWFSGLTSRDRGRARRLVARLGELGVRDAESIVRQDLTGGVPTVARLALADRLAMVLLAGGKEGGAIDGTIEQLIATLDDGRDDELGVRWRLVDGDDRPIGLTAADLRAATKRRSEAARKES